MVASATLAILLVCFFIYDYSQLDPATATRLHASRVPSTFAQPVDFPAVQDNAAVARVSLGGRVVDLGPGQRFEMTLYSREGTGAWGEISGTDWQPPLLAHLLEDPYAAVRYVAYRSLREFAGFEDFEYNFVESGRHQSEAKVRALANWQQHRTEPSTGQSQRVLISPDGQLLQAELQRLLEQRNDRQVILPE